VGLYAVVYVMPDYKSAKLQKANPKKEKINRIGITVTKKLGSAVVRNRAKRIIREAFRTCDKEHMLRRGNLIVIVARQRITDVRSTDLRKDFDKAFSVLGLFTK